ncbi:MAG: BRCT domain-containing protein [Ferrimonas sp.]
MTVFELLGIKAGDAIKVDHNWSNNGPRYVIPLSFSRHEISIRAIDTRHGNICHVSAKWTIFMHDGSKLQLQDLPYIKLKLDRWNSLRLKEETRTPETEIHLEDIEREFATLDEVLNTININGMKVAITGTLPIPRANVKSLLEDKGAFVMENISNQTSFLFMGNTGRYEITSKMKKAHDLGVKIITL